MSLGLDVRGAYLRTLDRAVGLVGTPEVAAAWDRDSVLEKLTVRGLVGHLTRAGALVEEYLDAGIPDHAHDVGDAAGYYAFAALTPDVDDPLNTSIRERGEAEAAVGHAALVAEFTSARDRLGERLAAEPVHARIAVRGGVVLPLDEYLVTRIVELAVHTDDLASSVAVPTPEPDPVASTIAVHALVALARRRHGDLAVLRALTRRERDGVGALRAF